jgi:SNF2 family DNA or RNA helicase
MNNEFIIAIKDYKNLGFVPFAHIARQNKGKGFLTFEEPVTEIIIECRPEEFTPQQKKIVSLINEYSDLNLMKRFSKKITNTNDFYKQLDSKLVEEQIRPFIEKRIVKIFSILKDTEIDIYYKDEKNSSVYISEKITIHKDPANTIFNFQRHEEGTKYFLSIEHLGKEMTLTNKPVVILVIDPCIMILENNAFFFTDVDGKKLLPFITKPFVHIPQKMEKAYYNGFVYNSIKSFNVKASGFIIETLTPQITTVLKIEQDLELNLYLGLYFLYADLEIKASDINDCFVNKYIDDEFVFQKINRDFSFEKHAIEYIKNLGYNELQPACLYPHNNDRNNSENYNHNFLETINTNAKHIALNGIKLISLNLDKDFYLGSVELEITQQQTVDKNTDWFEVNARVKMENFEIAFYKFKKNIINDLREYQLPDGKIVILPIEWFSKYKNLFQFGSEKIDSIIKIQKQHAHLFENEITDAENIKKIFEGKIKISAIPKSVNALLRKYQTEGFSWLNTLRENGLGGCLADDMGLGKTLQTLTFLSALYEEKSNILQKGQQLNKFDTTNIEINKKASLIVLPVSLIYNWIAEIRKFTPHLKFLVHAGVNRGITTKNFDNYNLIISSYGIVKNDLDLLRDYMFSAIILDESQAIKNPQSKNYQAVTELQAKNRFVLTGTPVENSLNDLWAQMNFINPGLLGKQSFFKKNFVTPIEKQRDQSASEKLKKLIKPFILRRTKFEVEKDLPELIEQVLYCEMSASQKSVYESEKSAIRNLIIGAYSNNELGAKINIAILQGLTKLRQIANHPALTGENEELDSGKFDEVCFRLETLVSGNHKVLVFSSFTSHLNLFVTYLKEKKLKYSLLTGSLNAKQREKEIQAFQNDKNNSIFLISIKAGGTGLNLTSADYVFILDPWWNPAVEQQAIARAHRIGQTSRVFVYRFISPETVEEKIQVLKEKKSQLADAFINTNQPFDDFSKEELMQMFE